MLRVYWVYLKTSLALQRRHGVRCCSSRSIPSTAIADNLGYKVLTLVIRAGGRPAVGAADHDGAITVPAEALVGRLTLSRVLLAFGVAAGALAAARFVWTRGLRHYSGASA